MGKLLRLICVAAVLTMFAGCGNNDDPDPDPEPVQETWLMTYDDYHYYVGADPEYKNLSREVTFVRNGDELYIKGIFEDYPDAWINCMIKGNKVFINPTQAMETDTDTEETVYFHWGYARDRSGEGHTFRVTGIAFFPMDIRTPTFTIWSDGNTMTMFKDPVYTNGVVVYSGEIVSFWHTKDPEGIISYDWGYYKPNEFSTTWEERGTGFPDVDIKVNISFRKVSDANTENK